MGQLPGIRWLRSGFYVAAVLIFLGCWVWFFWEIWTHSAHPVALNARALYISSLIGGALGTYFALVMGISTESSRSKIPAPGRLIGRDRDSKIMIWFVTFAVYAYAGVGVFAVVTWVLRSAQSPPAVEALASVFIGFFAAIIGAGLLQATPSELEPPQA